MTVDEVLDRLRALAAPGGREGMARFGVNTERALGVRVPSIRKLAREIGRDHDLALGLWQTGIHEARILASMLADPERVDDDLMEGWVAAFDSWDLCDQVCGNLFDRTPHAYRKALEWSERPEEFVKRAGFALMAYLAVHDKAAPDDALAQFLPVIETESDDDRNYVWKAVCWALRQIGKRNAHLHAAALEAVEAIAALDARAARRIASEARRELTSEKVLARFS